MSSSQSYFEKSGDRIRLPKPDLKNITVLTRKLPNIPILPWNHYDSPWLQFKAGDRSDQSATQ